MQCTTKKKRKEIAFLKMGDIGKGILGGNGSFRSERCGGPTRHHAASNHHMCARAKAMPSGLPGTLALFPMCHMKMSLNVQVLLHLSSLRQTCAPALAGEGPVSWVAMHSFLVNIARSFCQFVDVVGTTLLQLIYVECHRHSAKDQ